MSKMKGKMWGVRVNEVISYKDLVITAESVHIEEGDLIFRDEGGYDLFCVARGDWFAYYASNKAGLPTCVENWAPVDRNDYV